MFENVLSTMIFLPIVFGLTAMLVPFSSVTARRIGLISSLIVLLLGIKVYLEFSGNGQLEFAEKRALIESAGIFYRIGIDGISLFVLLTGVALIPIVFVVVKDRPRAFYGSLLVTEGLMTGAICAADLVLFYGFWETMLIPIFFMIGIYGGPGRRAAAIKTMLYTVSGSLLMLAAIIYLGAAFHDQYGIWSFATAGLAGIELSDKAAVLAFFAFMIAFAIKIPIFPLHTWLPDAYTESPTAATFLLSAIMAKIGIYAVIRFIVPVFGPELVRYAIPLAWAAVIGLIYCGVAAIGQKDMKRLLAFSSASHMGVLALGTFCLNIQALTGSIYQIIAHATSIGLLFLLIGMIEDRLQTREISDLGGIARQAPVFSCFFAIALLASVGLPGTSGFIGEFLIIMGAIKFNTTIGVFTATTLIIGVCYMLWMFQRVFFEKSNDKTQGFVDLSICETLAFLPVVVLILLMGVFPQPFIARITPAVQSQIATIQGASQPVGQLALDHIQPQK